MKQWGVGTMQDFVKAKKERLKKGSRRFNNIYSTYRRWCNSTFVNLAPMDETDFQKIFPNYFKQDSGNLNLPESHRLYKLIGK